MKPDRFHPLLLAILALALAVPITGVAAPTNATAPSRVSVQYQNPHNFSENRLAGFVNGYDHGDYLQKLRKFLVHTASPMLGTDEHLSITFTDIKLAGSYEPWRGPRWDRVRFMRNIYPPRFELTFKLTGADGQVLRQGSRNLIGTGYLYSAPARFNSTDPLYYDEAVLERWLHTVLKKGDTRQKS